MAENDSRNLSEFFTRSGLQGILGGVEEHVGHIDDQSACRITRLQYGVELRQQLLAQLLLILFGLLALVFSLLPQPVRIRRRCTCTVGFGSQLLLLNQCGLSSFIGLSL